MKIVIEIELGNEAMQTMHDVVGAVERLAHGPHEYDFLDPLAVGDEGRFRDLNGNTVGGWKVVEDSESHNGGGEE